MVAILSAYMDLFSDVSWALSYTNIFTAITLVLAYLASYSAARINRKNKIADVVMHCIDRYDAIARDKMSIRTKDEAAGYMRRFFGLKSDQFDYWLSGMVDAENISSWTYSVLNSFEARKSVWYWEGEVEKHMTLEEGWEAARKSHLAANVAFVGLMDTTLRIAKEEKPKREKYLALISELVDIEKRERDFIRFADVRFIMRRIRSDDMRAFQRMEQRRQRTIERHAERVSKS